MKVKWLHLPSLADAMAGVIEYKFCEYFVLILNDGVSDQRAILSLKVTGPSSRFALCYDLTAYNFNFLLYLETDDSDCEVTIVVLDGEGEDFALALTAEVNLREVLERIEEYQTKRRYLCACIVFFSMMVISLIC